MHPAGYAQFYRQWIEELKQEAISEPSTEELERLLQERRDAEAKAAQAKKPK